MINVAVVDDHPLILEAVESVLRNEDNIEVSGSYRTGAALLEALRMKPVDVVVADYHLPDIDGLQLVKQIRIAYPDTKIVSLSMVPIKQHGARLLSHGVSAFVHKGASVNELPNTIRVVATGKRVFPPEFHSNTQVDSEDKPPLHEALTDREFQIFLLLVGGMSVTEISKEIHLGRSTVSTYVARIKRKLDVQSTAEMTAYAIEHELVDKYRSP